MNAIPDLPESIGQLHTSLRELLSDTSLQLKCIGDIADTILETLGEKWYLTGLPGPTEFIAGEYWSSVRDEIRAAEIATPSIIPFNYLESRTNEYTLAQVCEECYMPADMAAELIIQLRHRKAIRDDLKRQAERNKNKVSILLHGKVSNEEPITTRIIR